MTAGARARTRVGRWRPRSATASARVESGSFELGEAPAVILFVGVNGTGKTTTIAKLAYRLLGEGKSVALAAADTFRAAAIEQPRIWGDQLGVAVVGGMAGADPGAVAFDAVAAAESRGLDAVLVDTAGRLQNKQQLMDELSKIRQVIERCLPGQPRHVLLVLDATTGQNGLPQGRGLQPDAADGIVTKLDGSAKGGVALAAADRLGVPIVFAGVGGGSRPARPLRTPRPTWSGCSRSDARLPRCRRSRPPLEWAAACRRRRAGPEPPHRSTHAPNSSAPPHVTRRLRGKARITEADLDESLRAIRLGPARGGRQLQGRQGVRRARARTGARR